MNNTMHYSLKYFHYEGHEVLEEKINFVCYSLFTFYCYLEQKDRHMARIAPAILLHFLHPWRSDVAYQGNARSNYQEVLYHSRTRSLPLVEMTDGLFDVDY